MPFCALFDSSATHFSISTQYALGLDLKHVKEETDYRINLLNDRIVDCYILYKHVPIRIGEFIFPMNLI